MHATFCAQPIYDDGKGIPAPSNVMPSPLGWLSDLWRVPTPAYQGQGQGRGTTGAAAPSSPSSGFLCWLFGSSTPVYQTAPPLLAPGTTKTRDSR